MRHILWVLMLSLFSFSSLFAGSIPDGAIYSGDGTYWYSTSTVGAKTTLMVDGVEKGSYDYFSSNDYVWNTLYSAVSNTTEPAKTYLLKDGNIIDSATILTLVTEYLPVHKIVGYSTLDAWVFQLKHMDGTIIFSDNNAGSYSSVSSLAPGILQSTIYDKNNNIATTYINEKKIPGTSYSFIGTLKKGKTSELLFSSLNQENITTLMFYNPKSQKFRKLPSYDGVGTYGYTSDTHSNIKDLQYSVMIGEKYAIADISGKIVSDERFDSVTSVTSYGDALMTIFKKWEKIYFSFGKTSFDKSTYGPYDQIDSFNVSYGFDPSNYTSVKQWSIFVQRNGKNAIIVNGKEVAL